MPLLVLIFLGPACHAQVDISLYQQFNGRYDFTFVGNTLNPTENNIINTCTINTSSSANLNLGPGDTIIAAYLYWAGSGSGVDTIKLNGQDISATRGFLVTNTTDVARVYFSNFADVTQQVQATGNGTYTVSDFDLNPVISQVPRIYCNNSTNFGGWAIIVIYKNDNFPLNQINLYDGLEFVPNSVDITLSSLNVIDNIGAKIGFLAWEGDANLAINERLKINGNSLQNPPLNPLTNAFNGTNSITGSNTLYNMDLDVYDIQGFINIGSLSAEITLESGQDFVMINTILTKLNSQLPDATVTVNNVGQQCGSGQVQLNYTVFNVNSTDVLPAGTAVSVYVDGIFITHFTTTAPLPVGGSESGSITITLPENTEDNFEVKLIADNLNGVASIKETDETNNTYTLNLSKLIVPTLPPIPPLLSCNEGFGAGTFDFSGYSESLKNNPEDSVTFYENTADATQGANPILDPSNYRATSSPKEILVRLEAENGCYAIGSFLLNTRLCPPETYNYVTPNGDGLNDTFFVKGLRNIFLNFKMSIYNRWGNLVWTGNNATQDWDGIANEEKVGPADANVPSGTYYFVLELNEPDYPKPIVGWVYVTK
ncbi:hypothetical protein CHU92_13950 [Flavobacterium cyanobacteriorum]|uniref:Uncharacterized protein n=2 Tax=Flavobacterium cyanobacteriorum TaxID=2022802 RepID=A0A255YV11_9FLAO|nr:hypothetical protein CHU92_13950 [Flavobacterium cyanobacteriorum]